MSLKFHYTIADITAKICSNISRKEKLYNVVLSGGGFPE